MAPSRLLPFARSSVLSWKGKLRVAMEPFVPARRNGGDESLASFVRRRLGEEALVRVAQPMVGGIYTADPERLSLRATMPRFADMEREHGGVVRGLIAARRRAAAGIQQASGPRYELFVALRAGMGTLPRTLAAKLPPGALQLGKRVTGLEPVRGATRSPASAGASTCRWYAGSERCGWNCRRPADRWRRTPFAWPCRAMPLRRRSRRFSLHSPASWKQSSTHRPQQSTLAFRREDVAHSARRLRLRRAASRGPYDARVHVQQREVFRPAPAGHALLRAFVGGALSPENFALDDGAMTSAVCADLRELLGVRREPLWSIVSRYARSMPQYHVGHLERMRKIDAALTELPTLALAGNAYIGAGIPDTIRSANAAAERLAAALGLTPSAA
jgi:oxygen-dependent protoporphyrinogen oxidase